MKKRARNRLISGLVFGLLGLVGVAACSAPDYEFVASSSSTSGSPQPQGSSGGPSKTDDDDDTSSSGGPSDAAADAPLGFDAQALTMTAMPSTGDIAADCTGYTVPGMNAWPVQDGTTANHCVMFFHSSPWKRTYAEAKTMCAQITRGAKQGHLAVFPDAKTAPNMVGTKKFPDGMSTWIGLELTGAAATDKASWTWITGQSAAGYDGWVAPPSGKTCASWAGTSPLTAQWIDADCPTLKGILCEMDP